MAIHCTRISIPLRLCLVCTYGTPVADMLMRSPPLPLIIDYGDEGREMTAMDEQGIMLALHRRRRVRHIRLSPPPSNSRKLVGAIDGEFPMSEYFRVELPNGDDPCPVLPELFKAPHLRHFSLRNVVYSSSISRLPPPLLRFESVDMIGQCARLCGSRVWRYALFFCCGFQLVVSMVHE